MLSRVHCHRCLRELVSSFTQTFLFILYYTLDSYVFKCALSQMSLRASDVIGTPTKVFAYLGHILQPTLIGDLT